MSYFIIAKHSVPPMHEAKAPAYAGEHMRTARKVALLMAARESVDVIIAREGAKGALRDVIIVHPDGSAEPPDNVKVDPREVCRRLQTGGSPCFCRVCRAERRAAK